MQGLNPKRICMVPGALDLCFIASQPLVQVLEKLETEDWSITEGLVLRAGARIAAFMGSSFAQPVGRPITIVMSTPEGGTTDIAARMLA